MKVMIVKEVMTGDVSPVAMFFLSVCGCSMFLAICVFWLVDLGGLEVGMIFKGGSGSVVTEGGETNLAGGGGGGG